MGNRVQCYWLEPTDQAQQSLRRYRETRYFRDAEGYHVLDAKGCCQLDAANNPTCPLMPGQYSYHNASVVLGVVPMPEEYLAKGYVGGSTMPFPCDDPRWPASCGCGYAFEHGDVWQHNLDGLYRGAPDGQPYPLRDAPVGAMWDAKWWPDKGPDGRALFVRLPNGHDWHVDAQGRAALLLDPSRRAAERHGRQERQHVRGRCGIDPERQLPRLPARRLARGMLKRITCWLLYGHRPRGPMRWVNSDGYRIVQDPDERCYRCGTRTG